MLLKFIAFSTINPTELHSYYVFRAKVYFVLNEQPMEVIRRCKAQEDGWRVS